MFENYYQRDKHREWEHLGEPLKPSPNGRLPRRDVALNLE